MGRRRRSDVGDRERLERILETCDPELLLFSLLVTRALLTRGSHSEGNLSEHYAQNRQSLIALAKLPPEGESAWRAGDWPTVEKFLHGRLEIDWDVLLPVNQGWPP